MGPMFLLIFGMLGSVGLYMYQSNQMNRFDVVADTKRGGIYIFDHKTAGVNYCKGKECVLVGKGGLPSQAMQNSVVFGGLQSAIMGMPAGQTAPGQVPDGMDPAIAKSKAKVANTPPVPKPKDSDASSDEATGDDVTASADGASTDAASAEAAPAEAAPAETAEDKSAETASADTKSADAPAAEGSSSGDSDQ